MVGLVDSGTDILLGLLLCVFVIAVAGTVIGYVRARLQDRCSRRG